MLETLNSLSVSEEGGGPPTLLETRAGRPCPPLEESTTYARGPLGTKVPAYEEVASLSSLITNHD